MASESYISSIMDESIYDDMYGAAINLSDLLGDIDGKVTPALVKDLISNLNLVTSEVIEFTGESEGFLIGIPSTIEIPIVLPERVNSYTFEVYNKMKVYDSDYVLDSYSYSSYPVNSELLASTGQTIVIAKQIVYYIFIECYALYLDLINSSKEYGLSYFSKEDIKRIKSVVTFCSFLIENPMSAKIDPFNIDNFELVSNLRWVEKTLNYIMYFDYLFKEHYTSVSDQYTYYLEE